MTLPGVLPGVVARKAYLAQKRVEPIVHLRGGRAISCMTRACDRSCRQDVRAKKTAQPVLEQPLQPAEARKVWRRWRDRQWCADDWRKAGGFRPPLAKRHEETHQVLLHPVASPVQLLEFHVRVAKEPQCAVHQRDHAFLNGILNIPVEFQRARVCHDLKSADHVRDDVAPQAQVLRHLDHGRSAMRPVNVATFLDETRLLRVDVHEEREEVVLVRAGLGIEPQADSGGKCPADESPPGSGVIIGVGNRRDEYPRTGCD